MTDPAPRLLGDIVPLLRTDLSIAQKPDGPGLFEVGIRGDERTFTLYDFEVSIARMLNGRRTVSDLIEAAARIGIPVSLESFQKFTRQLQAYGFLTAPEAPPPLAEDEATWVPRAEWKPEVRELFQSALRTFRKDRVVEARGYLEALLQISPEVPEAIELLARIEERIAAGESAPKQPSFDELHAPMPIVSDAPLGLSEASVGESSARTERWEQSDRSRSAGRDRSPAGEAPAPVQEHAAEAPPELPSEWTSAPHGEGDPAAPVNDDGARPPMESALPEPVTAGVETRAELPASSPSSDAEGQFFSGAATTQAPEPSPDDVEPLADERQAVRRSKWPLAVAAAVVVVAMAGVLAVPVDVSVTAQAEIAPVAAPVEVTAPRDGIIARLVAQPGEWLEPGAVIVAFDDAEIAGDQAATSKALASIERQLQGLQRRAKTPAARKARAAVQKKESEVERLETSRAKLAARAKSSRTRRALAAVDRTLKKKRAELAKLKRAAAKRSPDDAIAALTAKADALKAKQTELESRRAALEMKVDAPGLFTTELEPGSEVKAGQVIARLEDVRTLRARLAVSGAGADRIAPGQAVTLRFGKDREHTVTTELTGGAGPRNLEVTIDNAQRLLPAHATGEAVIECGTRPWLSSLLGG